MTSGEVNLICTDRPMTVADFGVLSESVCSIYAIIVFSIGTNVVRTFSATAFTIIVMNRYLWVTNRNRRDNGLVDLATTKQSSRWNCCLMINSSLVNDDRLYKAGIHYKLVRTLTKNLFR